MARSALPGSGGANGRPAPLPPSPAWLAKEAGFKGLFLDVEHYAGSLGPWGGKHIFDYEACPRKDTHTLEEVAAQIQLRGRELMQAVSQAYPDITIIIIQNTGWGRSNLVEFFVRGMLEARGRATIIDGGEGGYFRLRGLLADNAGVISTPGGNGGSTTGYGGEGGSIALFSLDGTSVNTGTFDIHPGTGADGNYGDGTVLIDGNNETGNWVR